MAAILEVQNLSVIYRTAKGAVHAVTGLASRSTMAKRSASSAKVAAARPPSARRAAYFAGRRDLAG